MSRRSRVTPKSKRKRSFRALRCGALPRNRTPRLAVLGSSVQQSAARRYASRNATAVRRRLVVGVLVALSIALVTASFRGGVSGPQATAAGLLRPFQVAAERVARPFRD